jgi:hypothetical protein
MPANTYGRQVVEALVNKSGGAVAAGDVVIIDTTNDGAFTTTTTGQSQVTIGIVQETIASNATGRVLLSGFAALVNVPASVTRGHFVETHTVAKQATGNSSRRSGSFGQFRTGGTTPTAVIWGNTDTPASGSYTAPVTGQAKITAGTNSTSSSYADVTGAAITMTTTGGRQVRLAANVQISNSAGTAEYISLTFSVDGTNVDSGNDIFSWLCPVSAWQGTVLVMYVVPAASVAAGSHTFKLRIRRLSGTNTVSVSASASSPSFMYAEEILA